jgi:hypothetical protein
MANDKNIRIFTAADIEKYHRGLLSTQERHDLEKAALDDPFLADALEGYATAGVNANDDLAELRKRLNEKVLGGKVVSMNPGGGRTRFPLLRVAAVLVLITGAALLTNQFFFKDSSNTNISKVEEKKNETPAPVEDTSVSNQNLTDTTVEKFSGSTDISFKLNKALNDSNTKTVIGTTTFNANLSLNTGDVRDSSTFSNVKTSPVPAIVNPDKNETESVYRGEISSKDRRALDKSVAQEESKQKVVANKKDVDAEGVYARTENPKAVNKVQKSVAFGNSMNREKSMPGNPDNYFRGRVVDANNNPVPFANITSTRDNAGTYTDAKGFFNFVSPDTVLEVQVRSIGFENSNTQLRNNVSSNDVVMRDDKSLSEVVISTKKPNTLARERSNAKLEEPEPLDGWENYDAYLVNNLKTPEEIKGRQTVGETTGEVELSFEVNKNGEPVNIKVEKSLCSDCDKEAIRLIREGPKWKRKARKGRTIVTVPF